jgi:hypothetical protein
MELKERIKAFEKLGVFLGEHSVGVWSGSKTEHEVFVKLIEQVKNHNAWFTPENVSMALESIAASLQPANLQAWIQPYQESLAKPAAGKKVLVIMAGNIPLVGFHDFLCVLVSGNRFQGKVSSDDHLLLPFLAALLLQFEPRFKDAIEFTEGLVKDMQAVIATGSTNSSRYFDYYFGKYPHIIRKNRHSVAILDGHEKPEDMAALGKDIFQYYGLGCRNVSKLFVPSGYQFGPFFEGIFGFAEVLKSNKYVNNYEYNKTIYLLNSEKLLDNNFLLLREDIALSSPIGVLFFEYYQDKPGLKSRLHMDQPYIQCIVSKDGSFTGSLPFGQTQTPMLWDYADGVDTMRFLLEI